jgi:hypothetical protein
MRRFVALNITSNDPDKLDYNAVQKYSKNNPVAMMMLEIFK